MPVNEFDLSVRPDYVSNRLAIPFNELNAMAAQHQKEYDNAEDSAYKFKDLMASVKAIHDPSLGLSNIGAKDALYSNYAPRIEAISNEIAKGTNIGEANRKLSQLQREWVNDPIRVELENSYANYAKYVEDKTKKGGKYDPLLDDYRGQQLIGEKGELKPFRFNGMEDALDIEKRFSESMDKIKEDMKGWDIESLGADGIKIGKKGTQAGITADKVMGVARTKVQGMLTQTLEGQQFVKKLRRLNPNLTNEELVNEGVKALFASGSEQIGMEETSGNSVDVTPMWAKKYDEGIEAEKAKAAILGTSGESPTTNMIASNPAFTSLIDKGIVSVDLKNGLVNIDYSKMNNTIIYDIRDAGGKVVGSTYDIKKAQQQVKDSNGKLSDFVPRKVSSTDSHKELADLAVVAMRSIGYTPKGGKLTSDDYPKIFSAYNMLSKARFGAEILSANVQQIVTDQVMNQQDAYSVYDNDGNYKSELNITPDEKFHADKRISIGGKSYLQGFIDRPTGNKSQPYERVPITVRAESKQDNEFFDEGAKVAKDAIEFISTNKANKDAGGDDRLIVGNSNGETKYIKKFTSGQLAGGITYEGYADSKNPSNQTYHINLPTGESLDFNDYNSFLRNLNSLYYYDTKSGQSAVEWLKTQAKQSESLTN